MNKLIAPFFIIISLFITACNSDNNENEPMSPFSLEKTYYEVRLWRSITEIPITNGSGDISLSVADKTIIEANKVLNEGGSTYVSLQGKQKGSTTLTLTDNVTGDEETVEVKVTDCYIAYGIAESNHPALASNIMLYLVNNEARDCYFFTMDNIQHQLYNTPIAKGTYEFFVTIDAGTGPAPQLYGIPHLRLAYPSDADGNFADEVSVHDFQIELYGDGASSPNCLEIIKAYLGVDWEELISNATTKSVPPRDYTMVLTIPDTDYEIIGAFATASIPEYILN